MRIPGYIHYGHRPPAPFVAAAVYLCQLGVRGRLPLLLDTGSSSTMILWQDVERLGIDISKMEPEREFSGLGGLVSAKPTVATIGFGLEREGLIEEDAQVYVVTSDCPHPKLRFLPSILGRDIINDYTLSYSCTAGKIFLEK